MTTTETVTVDVPSRFLEDHLDRATASTLVIVKHLARTTRVTLDRTAYDNLQSDADHYAGYAMAEFWADGGSGIILSARATVKVLAETPRP